MRLFTAIEIPVEVREALRAFVERLKPLAKFSWSHIDNLHVTTKFIGEWPESRLQEMVHVLEGVANAGPIDIRVRGIGWFPDERHPRVFWAGVEASQALGDLAHATEQAVATLGVPAEDRRYSPHLTFARIREAIPLDPLRRAIQNLPSGCGFDFGSFQAAEFFLYSSAGGRYSRLARFSLF